MTTEELQSLCQRHEIPARDAQMVLDRVLTKLVPPSPSGIGLKPECIGSLMEAVAVLNDIRNKAPYNECEFCSTAEAVIRFLPGGDLE